MPHVRMTRAVLCLLAGTAMPTLASAQDLPYVPDFFGVQPQTYADVPNIPGPNGCVKWCIRDDTPCDSPSFKKADGRCHNTDTR